MKHDADTARTRSAATARVASHPHSQLMSGFYFQAVTGNGDIICTVNEPPDVPQAGEYLIVRGDEAPGEYKVENRVWHVSELSRTTAVELQVIRLA